MRKLTPYVGSVVLSALLLWGCGGSHEDQGFVVTDLAATAPSLQLDRSTVFFESQLDDGPELTLDYGEVAIMRSDDGSDNLDDSGTAWTDELLLIAPTSGPVTLSLDSLFLKRLSLYGDGGELIYELTRGEQGTVELRGGVRYKIVLEDNGAAVNAQTDEIQEGAYAVSFLNQSERPFLSVGQKLVGVDISDVDFSRQDLSGLNFTGSSLLRCRFIGTKLHQTVFFNAGLRGCEMADAEFVRTDLRETRLESGTQLERADLRTARFQDTLWSDCQLTDSSFEGNALNKVRFTNVTLTDVSFRSCPTSFLYFSGCTFSGVDFSRSSSRRLTFHRCQASGVDRDSGLHFDGATFRDFNTADTQMAFASFRGSVFEAPNSFYNSDLSSATFVETIGFNGIEFRNTTLTGVIGPDGRPLP